MGGKTQDIIRHICESPGIGARRQHEGHHRHIREILMEQRFHGLVGCALKVRGLAIIPLHFLNELHPIC